MNASRRYPATEDGRYFVAKGRLWRCTDPSLSATQRQYWVQQLMQARRAVGKAQSSDERQQARDAVQRAKEALGERGPVWWSDGAPDVSRKKPENTIYAEWWARLDDDEQQAGRD